MLPLVTKYNRFFLANPFLWFLVRIDRPRSNQPAAPPMLFSFAAMDVISSTLPTAVLGANQSRNRSSSMLETIS